MSSFYMRFMSICILALAMSSNPASAWWQAPTTPPTSPPQTEPAAKPKTTAATIDKSKAADDSQAKAKADRAAKAKAKRAAAAKKRKGKPKLEMNPDAKWACDQQAAMLEPVWRSDETLVFPFLIRNEGTADLLIRAKGG